MEEEADYLTLAKITRPRGNRGEVSAENLTDGLRGFAKGGRLEAQLPNRVPFEVEVEEAWEHNGRLILKFAGYDSIAAAEGLRFAEVRTKRASLEPLPEGEYFLDDLIGCRMIDQAGGRDVGIVAEVYEPPGGVLLFSVEDDRGRELLVPYADEICLEVDIEGKRILVRLPEGMEDLKA